MRAIRLVCVVAAVVLSGVAGCTADLGPEGEVDPEVEEAEGDESAPGADLIAAAPTLDIFMAAQGGLDANDGRVATRAVRTFDRVQQILVATNHQGPVRVRVGPGLYTCRELRTPWTYRSNHRVSIEPRDPVPAPASASQIHPNRPVFVGVDAAGAVCPGSVWFQIDHARVAVNLTIQGLLVTKYRGAISIRNPAAITTLVDQKIVVRNMVFEKIGSLYHKRPSTSGFLAGKGAILLSYSYGSVFEHNYFGSVRNHAGSEGLIHAFYFTTHASRHVVANNVLSNCSGAFIKLTNFSNDNDLTDNSFTSGTTAVVDRWCGAKSSDPASCLAAPECPSWNNYFPLEHNTWANLTNGTVHEISRVPAGQTCAHAPPASRIRMDLGFGGLVR